MRVLHLFSNYKFTGPADPALVLARALQSAGIDVTFAAGRTPAGDRGVLELARERGLPVRDGLHLQKHGRPIPWLHDVKLLTRWLRTNAFDLIHTHLPNDHHIATTAARKTETPVLRSLYDLEAPRGGRARRAFARTRHVLPPTEGSARALAATYPALADRTTVVAPVLDLARFEGVRHPSIRSAWRIGDQDFVVGVVARMQLHRRFPELIEGFARAAREDSGLHLVVLGRGTNQKIVAHDPAARSGVPDQIHFPGYIDPATYPKVLPAFDALIFLVPGSDGTCRAMREAQLSGVPVIVSNRGLLPDLMVPGETGKCLEEDSPAQIAAALASLRADPGHRRALAEGARAFALRHFDGDRAAGRVIEVYERLFSGEMR